MWHQDWEQLKKNLKNEREQWDYFAAVKEILETEAAQRIEKKRVEIETKKRELDEELRKYQEEQKKELKKRLKKAHAEYMTKVEKKWKKSLYFPLEEMKKDGRRKKEKT